MNHFRIGSGADDRFSSSAFFLQTIQTYSNNVGQDGILRADWQSALVLATRLPPPKPLIQRILKWQEPNAMEVHFTTEVQAKLDRRYDDLESGRVKPIDGEAFFESLRKREDERLKKPTP